MGIENPPQNKNEATPENKETTLKTAPDTYKGAKKEFGDKKALKLAKPIFTTIGISEEEFIKKVENK